MIAFLLIGTSRVVGQEKSDAAPVNLKGIWQMCFYVSGTPQVPGELNQVILLKFCLMTASLPI